MAKKEFRLQTVLHSEGIGSLCVKDPLIFDPSINESNLVIRLFGASELRSHSVVPVSREPNCPSFDRGFDILPSTTQISVLAFYGERSGPVWGSPKSFESQAYSLPLMPSSSARHCRSSRKLRTGFSGSTRHRYRVLELDIAHR